MPRAPAVRHGVYDRGMRAGPLLLLLAAACGSSSSNDGSDGGVADAALTADGAATLDGAPDDAAQLTTVTFDPTDEVFPNPERGFYKTVDLVNASGFSSVVAAGMTLAIDVVYLDEYLDRPLDQPLLDALEAGFARARETGVSIILRFAYTDSQSLPDAPLDVVLGHIGQLAPLLARNADVIAVLQAGFVGAWGEWHSSSNNLEDSGEEILTALLAALPASRKIQVRTPMIKDAIYGGPLTGPSTTDAGRLGHHNDCFLASDSDYGTYADPLQDWKDFVAQEGQFTPVGGETCKVNEPRSLCAAATAEMEAHHWTYLNSEYHPDVLASWTDCRSEVERRLGYRLVLDSASFAADVAAGGGVPVSVTLHNEGYAAPINARPVRLVLDGPTRITLDLDVDVRGWLPGPTVTLTGTMTAPPAGTYRLALEVEGVRFANDGVWSASTEDNTLGTVVVAP
jgi:hypothetical protein